MTIGTGIVVASVAGFVAAVLIFGPRAAINGLIVVAVVGIVGALIYFR